MIQSQPLGANHFFVAIFLIVSVIGYGQIRVNAQTKDSLNNVVNKLYEDDQKYRWIVMLGEEDSIKLDSLKKLNPLDLNKRIFSVMEDKVGLPRLKKDSIWIKQLAIDTTNTKQLKGIISKFGYPDFYTDPVAISTILLHSPDCFLDSLYLMQLKKEVVEKRMNAGDYAMLYDRFLIKSGLPEQYYILTYFDSVNNKSIIHTPINLKLTNKLRKEIGLKKIKQKDLK